MDYIGDFAEDATVQLYFTTSDSSGGAVAPSTAFEAADVVIYKNGSATQKTSTNGITMTSPFDSITGLHHVSIDTGNDTGDAGFWVINADYTVVLNPDETVDSQTVVKVLAQFSIENRTTQPKEDYPTNFALMGIETDGHVHGDVKEWLGTAVTTSSTTLKPMVDIHSISDDLGAADNLEADYDGTGYAKTNSTIGTTTTNTDMRGTDNAALASVVGALADAAAAGDPTSADTLMQYVKQLVNVLVGTTGVTTYPAAAAPANNVSLAEIIRAIYDDSNELQGDWADAGRLDAILDARASQTSVDTVDSNVDAILADTGTDGVVVSTATAQAIADEILNRSVSNVEGTPVSHSLAELILANFEFSLSGTTWTIKKTDGATTYSTRTVTTDAAAEPITDVT